MQSEGPQASPQSGLWGQTEPYFFAKVIKMGCPPARLRVGTCTSTPSGLGITSAKGLQVNLLSTAVYPVTTASLAGSAPFHGRVWTNGTLNFFQTPPWPNLLPVFLFSLLHSHPGLNVIQSDDALHLFYTFFFLIKLKKKPLILKTQFSKVSINHKQKFFLIGMFAGI